MLRFLALLPAVAAVTLWLTPTQTQALANVRHDCPESSVRHDCPESAAVRHDCPESTVRHDCPEAQ